MQFRTSDGINIHYQIDGPDDGEPLILSNSLGINLHMWDQQVADAPDDLRIIRYDQRGHGRSDAPTGAYSLDRLGKDIVDLLDHLSLEKVNFCGLSMGGMTGMWLGLHASQRIKKLVLANTSPHIPPATLWDERIETASTQGMPALVEGTIERWFSSEFRTTELDEIDRIRQMFLKTDPNGYIGCCAAIRDTDISVSIARIHLPTLVIIGAHDPTTPPSHGNLIVDSIEGSRAIELHAAHLSNVEKPDAFSQELFGFLIA